MGEDVAKELLEGEFDRTQQVLEEADGVGHDEVNRCTRIVDDVADEFEGEAHDAEGDLDDLHYDFAYKAHDTEERWAEEVHHPAEGLQRCCKV